MYLIILINIIILTGKCYIYYYFDYLNKIDINLTHKSGSNSLINLTDNEIIYKYLCYHHNPLIFNRLDQILIKYNFISSDLIDR